MPEKPLFRVPVADLEYGERDLDEEIPVEWLSAAFADTEAKPRGAPGRLEVTLSKSGREVMVRGHARASLVMPCARTLDPVEVGVDAEIFLLLAPGAAPPPVPGLADVRTRKARSAQKPPLGKTGSKSAGTGKSAKKREEAPELSDHDAARDTYDGELVVLDGFLREFLVLELPAFPLREDLRSEATPAIERPPSGPTPEDRKTREAVDPRLAPLAAIASRLRNKKE